MFRLRTILSPILLLLFGSSMMAKDHVDSLVMRRVFSYQRNFTTDVSGFSTNVYLKHHYSTERRNFTLWLVPTMYEVARGGRENLSESYSRLYFFGINDYDAVRNAFYTTISHNRQAMPTVIEFLTPNVYGVTLYGDHILSPFCEENRSYYRYSTKYVGGVKTLLNFRPRFVNNTQLVKGAALVDTSTGRIEDVTFVGEFDMIDFHAKATMGAEGARSLLPQQCNTDIEFKFLGNHITSHIEAAYDCPTTLPDTLSVRGDRHLLDSVRPYPLSAEEQEVYRKYDEAHHAKPDTVVTDTLLQKKPRRTGSRNLQMIGESLVNSLKAESENAYLKLSPIINPEYISYSKRKGLAYKMRLRGRWEFNNEKSLSLNTSFGYNFKLRKFYFTIPLRFTYAPKQDGYLELIYGNGNRIGNSTILDEIKREQGDLPELDGKDLDAFDDNRLQISNNIRLNRWAWFETGLVFHQRKSANASLMREYGKPTELRSLAPMVGLKLRPWPKAPLFSIDYERGLKGKNTDLDYERWEADASLSHKLPRMQSLNMRLGGGIYTRRRNNYFMDFSNFRDENLPGGWDDDWTGNFQLLSSRLYNESMYYVRGNVSYESPLLAASMVPYLGRYVERERVYLSSLLIDNHRLYSELGYGFTTRYVSLAFFTSFAGFEYQEAGVKFAFELFRRW